MKKPKRLGESHRAFSTRHAIISPEFLGPTHMDKEQEDDEPEEPEPGREPIQRRRSGRDAPETGNVRQRTEERRASQVITAAPPTPIAQTAPQTPSQTQPSPLPNIMSSLDDLSMQLRSRFAGESQSSRPCHNRKQQRQRRSFSTLPCPR